jgi:hypothetical protein
MNLCHAHFLADAFSLRSPGRFLSPIDRRHGIVGTVTPTRLDQRGIAVLQAQVLPDAISHAGAVRK